MQCAYFLMKVVPGSFECWGCGAYFRGKVALVIYLLCRQRCGHSVLAQMGNLLVARPGDSGCSSCAFVGWLCHSSCLSGSFVALVAGLATSLLLRRHRRSGCLSSSFVAPLASSCLKRLVASVASRVAPACVLIVHWTKPATCYLLLATYYLLLASCVLLFLLLKNHYLLPELVSITDN